MSEEIIGKCRLVKLIFNDGRAKIFVATDQESGEEVSIKILEGAFDAGEVTAKRFIQETELLARFSHPNITRFVRYGYDTQQKVLFLVMEYRRGWLLSDFIHSKKIPTAFAFEVAIQLCRALAYCHGRGVIHRNVRPESIFIRRDKVVVLTNFSMAKVYRPDWTDAGLTAYGKVIGSPFYMAPEQAACDKVTPRTDLYALGVCFHEMLTGKRPSGVLKPPSKTNTEIDERTDRLVKNLLAYEPEKRPATAELVLERILEIHGKALASAPAAGENPSPSPPATPTSAPQSGRSVDELIRKAKEKIAKQRKRGLKPRDD